MIAQFRKDAIRFEECKDGVPNLYPYQDTKGIWTIGIGHNIEADPVMKSELGALMKTGISEQEAYFIFDQDIANAEVDLYRVYPWVEQLDEPRRGVLVDMTFNMGISKVFQFHNTMNMIKDGRYHDAAENLKLSAWYEQVGNRAVNLCKILDTGEEA